MRKSAAVFGVMGAGVLAMGAGPPLPVPPSPHDRADFAARVLPQPRLYTITMTVDGRSEGPAQMCMSAESLLREMDANRARPRPADGTPPRQGCTHSAQPTPGGGMHMEMACDKAAGARTTFRMSADTDGHMGMRHHSEAQVEGAGGPRTMVTDTTIAAVGPCPADLKPGEMRLAGGRIVDAATRLSRAAGTK